MTKNGEFLHIFNITSTIFYYVHLQLKKKKFKPLEK
jgi:hypothetical protein